MFILFLLILRGKFCVWLILLFYLNGISICSNSYYLSRVLKKREKIENRKSN